MKFSPIVQEKAPVVFVGGGPVGAGDLDLAMSLAKPIIAADGGVAAVFQAGHRPDHVIGDMDSADPNLLAQIPRDQCHPIAEQDSTDFEKCLMRVAAPLVIGVGFRGGRFDHELAALHALLRFAETRCILLGRGEIVFLCPPDLTMDLGAQMPLSLFPLAPVTTEARGLLWSFDGLALEPGKRIGTSNQTTGEVHLKVNAPGLLCILPQDAITVVAAQLAVAPRWPAVPE